MRRLSLLFLAIACLIQPVRAEHRGYVALTFDDGPSGKYTRALLDGLYERGVEATFLLCGYRMKEYPDIAQRIHDEGHEIGYHGYSHKNLSALSRRDIASELISTQALLPQGCRPLFLRPPGGQCTDPVRQVAQARNLAVLGWSVDPRDWSTEDVSAIEAAVLDTIRDGDIVLLHDMTMSSVQAALEIVDVLLEQGFELVTVSRLARLRGVRPRPGQIYRSFPPEP